MTPARPAATVLLLRPADHGPEVLMLRRSGRSGFFPDAWVFPGGRVERSDADLPTMGRVDGLDEPRWAVAALRETFEEAGIWLGAGAPDADLRDRLNQRQGSLTEVPGLVADLTRVDWVAWWITPAVEPKRYDTRFFLVEVTRDEVVGATPCHIETVRSRWIRPIDAVAAQAQGELFLAPPTLRVLEDLSAAIDAPPTAGPRLPCPTHPIQPRLDGGRANPASPDGGPAEGMAVVLPGDPTYPSDHPAPGPTRIVLRGGVWRSEWAPDGGPAAG